MRWWNICELMVTMRRVFFLTLCFFEVSIYQHVVSLYCNFCCCVALGGERELDTGQLGIFPSWQNICHTCGHICHYELQCVDKLFPMSQLAANKCQCITAHSDKFVGISQLAPTNLLAHSSSHWKILCLTIRWDDALKNLHFKKWRAKKLSSFCYSLLLNNSPAHGIDDLSMKNQLTKQNKTAKNPCKILCKFKNLKTQA